MEQTKETTIVYPLGRNRHVVIHPQIQWGEPAIEGRRITTDCLYCMFAAGDSIAMLAHWYLLTTGDVEDAVRYEVMRRCKHGRRAIKKASITEPEAFQSPQEPPPR